MNKPPVMDAIPSESSTQVSLPGPRPSATAILSAAQATRHTDTVAEFRSVLAEGRMLQARFREWGNSSIELPGDLAVELGQWEGRARTALVTSPDRLREFANAPGHVFGLSAGDALRRTEHQLEVLEAAFRAIHAGGKSDQLQA